MLCLRAAEPTALGGPASAVLLLAVWPGNLQMALDATSDHGLSSPQAVLSWARLPLQVPLVWMALQDPTVRAQDR